MTDTRLNVNSPTPLYQQLYDVIKHEIVTKKYLPGDKIPSEQQLSQDYNVSRITVRKAMEMLTEDNYIAKRSGKGSFVTPNKIHEDLTGKQSFSLTCQYNALSSKSRILGQEVREATSFDAESLGIEEGSKIVYLKRLRYADNIPIMIETIYMKYDLFSYILNVDMSNNSLYAEVGKQFPAESRKIKRTVEISIATSEQANLLELPKGAPLLLCHEIVTTHQGLPLFRIRQFIAGERVRFTTIE